MSIKIDGNFSSIEELDNFYLSKLKETDDYYEEQLQYFKDTSDCYDDDVLGYEIRSLFEAKRYDKRILHRDWQASKDNFLRLKREMGL